MVKLPPLAKEHPLHEQRKTLCEAFGTRDEYPVIGPPKAPGS